MMKRMTLAFMSILAAASLSAQNAAAQAANAQDDAPDPEIDAPVKASMFGFDKNDASHCMQMAVFSGSAKIIIDNTGSPWYISEIPGQLNRVELILEDGVEIRPLPGSSYPNLIDLKWINSFTIRGEGNAKIVMNGNEYKPQQNTDNAKKPYANWQHIIEADHTIFLRLENITLEGSAGDAIFFNGNGASNCDEVVIKNVTFKNNAKAGITQKFTKRFKISGCKFIGTEGKAGEYGIIMSPTIYKERFVDTIISDCLFEGMKKAGLFMDVRAFEEHTVTQSLVFKNCVFKNNLGLGLDYTGYKVQTTGGSFQFSDCKFSGNKGGAISVNGHRDDNLILDFVNCNFDGSAVPDKPTILLSNGDAEQNLSGVKFTNCKIDSVDKLSFVSKNGYGITNVLCDIKQPDGKAVDTAALLGKYPVKFP